MRIWYWKLEEDSSLINYEIIFCFFLKLKIKTFPSPSTNPTKLIMRRDWVDIEQYQIIYIYIGIWTPLWISQHPPSVTSTSLLRLQQHPSEISSKAKACRTRDKLGVLKYTNLKNLLSSSSAFDIYKNDPNRETFDVGYQAWNERFLKLFQKLKFWCSSTRRH
jgi:hypothetical protein